MKTKIQLAAVFLLALTLLDLPVFAKTEERSSAGWEKTIAKFEAADSVDFPDPGVIVFIGSSSIKGWRTLKEDFAGMDVINRGFGGSEMFNAVAFAHRIVAPYKPSRVVLYEGDNDTAGGTEPETIAADLKAFIAKVRSELPGVPIYVLSVKPCPLRWKIWPVAVKTNRLFKSICDSDPTLFYVDIATPMLRESDGYPLPELFQQDSLHMVYEGYKLWTSVLMPYLSEPLEK
jgi:lysophospholipase L1-like esterase